MVGIRLVDGIGNIGFGQNFRDHTDELLNVLVLGTVGITRMESLRVKLKESQQFDLQPWTGGTVVEVFSGAGLLYNKHSQNVDRVGNQ